MEKAVNNPNKDYGAYDIHNRIKTLRNNPYEIRNTFNQQIYHLLRNIQTKITPTKKITIKVGIMELTTGYGFDSTTIVQ